MITSGSYLGVERSLVVSSPTIPAPATSVSETLIGTGSFQPETSVTNAEMLERLHPGGSPRATCSPSCGSVPGTGR